MLSRRQTFGLFASSTLLAYSPAWADNHDVWALDILHDALKSDLARLVDIRRPEEWQDTGVAEGAWPIDMTHPRFGERLFAARDLAAGRPVALICRTGHRSGLVMSKLREAKAAGFVDAVGGMLGAPGRSGWIERGLPTVTREAALAALPSELA